MKKPITVMITDQQYGKIKKISCQTGNSLNSIVRSAINNYLVKLGDN